MNPLYFDLKQSRKHLDGFSVYKKTWRRTACARLHACLIFKWLNDRLSISTQPSFLGVGGAVPQLNAITQDGKFDAERYSAPGRHCVEPVNQEQWPLLD